MLFLGLRITRILKKALLTGNNQVHLSYLQLPNTLVSGYNARLEPTNLILQKYIYEKCGLTSGEATRPPSF